MRSPNQRDQLAVVWNATHNSTQDCEFRGCVTEVSVNDIDTNSAKGIFLPGSHEHPRGIFLLLELQTVKFGRLDPRREPKQDTGEESSKNNRLKKTEA